VVLVEGFKGGDFPKLEVWRASEGRETLHPHWPGILALASDSEPAPGALPLLDLADTAAIAEFVLQHARQRS
jgi:molybdopterin-guanine dinucleotide biosynthesis protein B